MPYNPDKLPYQQWHEEEFMSDRKVIRLTPTQRWMYRSLLQSAWANSYRPYLPVSDEDLYDLAGCETLEQWHENKDSVLKFFFETTYDGSDQTLTGKPVYGQKRLLSDWASTINRCRVRSENGKKGGRPRHRDSPEVPKIAPLEYHVEKVEDAISAICGPPQPITRLLHQEEEDVRAVNKIRILCRRLLGISPDPDSFSSWKDLKETVKAFDNQIVIDAFETWTKQQDATEFASKGKWPISEFVKVATGLCSGVINLERDPRVEPLVFDLVRISDATVTFGTEQTRQIGRLLEKYTEDEIREAFRKFYSNVEDDSFKLKRAAKEFPEQAAQLIEYDRRLIQETQEAEFRAQEVERELRAQAARERAAADERDRKAVEESEDLEKLL